MNPPDPSSHLFLVRVWPAGDAAQPADWCGKVQHVTSGEAGYFAGWPALIALLVGGLPSPAAPLPPAVAPAGGEAGSDTTPSRA